MNGPFAVTTGPDQNIWFSAFNGTVSKVVGGSIFPFRAVPSLTANLRGIAPGANNTLWFLEEEGGLLHSISTAGVPTGVSIQPAATPGT